ncbi:MAG: EAL domain-containing protein [Clostridiales bacterium]
MFNQNIWLGLVNNSSWLLALFVIYEISCFWAGKNHILGQMVSGMLISAICIAVMAWPFSLFEGILFDTRSILISTTALAFGGIPVMITAGAAAFFRIIQGGSGTVAGLAAIASSAMIGLLWRRFPMPKTRTLKLLNVYLMSLVTHLAMILNMLWLPAAHRFAVIQRISLPVMLIYPVVSVVLSVLLFYQQERRQYQEGLKSNEEKYRLITENASDVVWTMDLDLRVTYISPSVERLLGESASQYMQRPIEERFSPETLKKIRNLYAQELAKEQDPAYPKDRTCIIELEHYKTDGTTLWLSMHIAFFRDAGGNIIGLHGVSRDITKQKNSEQALDTEKKKAQLYIEIAPVIFLTLDTDMNVTLINQEGCNILGLSRDQITGKNWPENFVPLKHRAALCQMIKNMFEGGNENYRIYDNSVITADNGERLISWRNIAMKDDEGNITGMLASGIDITYQMITINALQENERSKRVLLENLPGMAYRCKYDRDWTMEFVSMGCLDLTGYEPDSLLFNRDLSFNDLILPKYHEFLWNKWQEAVASHSMFEEEYEIVCAGGEVKWIWEQGQAIYDDGGSALCLEGLIIDITDRKKNEIKLKYLSECDSLTGLYNLRSFENIYKNRPPSPAAVMMINVRSFSVINRIFGFSFGNKLIQDIAACLSKYCAEGQILFHTAIDRFLLYLPQHGTKQELICLCENIFKSLDAAVGEKIVRFSIGVLELEADCDYNAEKVLKNVSTAAEYSPDHGRFGFCFFSKEIEEKQQREAVVRLSLVETLHNSSPENDRSLYMLYQPIIDLRTNKITGFEALARYMLPKLGVISPAEFIPIAEASQLMLLLGKRLMRMALEFSVHLARQGHASITLSFNISAIQILSETFLEDLAQLLEETGADPRNLNVEITESVFSDNYQKINEKLGQIKAMGMRVSIDDFGTGYSSLARVNELNINCLKIDKYFIDKLLSTQPENAITGDIISMAHKLGHCIVAEGVEQEQQKQYLVEHDCDMMQGYLFSKPLAPGAALELLQQTN